MCQLSWTFDFLTMRLLRQYSQIKSHTLFRLNQTVKLQINSNIVKLLVFCNNIWCIIWTKYTTSFGTKNRNKTIECFLFLPSLFYTLVLYLLHVANLHHNIIFRLVYTLLLKCRTRTHVKVLLRRLIYESKFNGLCQVHNLFSRQEFCFSRNKKFNKLFMIKDHFHHHQ